MFFELLVSILAILMFINMGIFAAIWGRRPLMIKAGLIMLPATSAACFVGIVQLYSPQLGDMVMLNDVSTLLFIVIFTSFIFMVMELTKRHDPFKPKVFVPFLVVPVIATFAILTDPWFHLFYQSETLTTSNALQQGILLTAPSLIGLVWIVYFDVVGTIFALVLTLFLHREYSMRMALVFLGGVVLIHATVLASYFIPDLNAVYPDNIAYSAAAAVIYLYSFQYGVFNLAPTGREKMLDAIEDSIVAVDSKGRIMDLNQACQDYLMVRSDAVVGKSFAETFSIITGLYPQYDPDGSMRLPTEVIDSAGRAFEVKVKGIKFKRLKGNLVVLHDLTERKKIEELMREAETQEKIAESERRYRMVVENQTEAILSFRPDGTVTFANLVLEKSLGHLGIGTKDLNVYANPDKWDTQKLKKTVDGLTETNPVGELDLIVKRPDGSDLDVLWRTKGIFDNNGRLLEIQGVGIDITQRRRMEQEMARNQKLESLGVLAGGIAHDFNNMLASIVSNIEIAMDQLPEDKRPKHRLEESVRSAMRARHLTHQLLTFSKGGTPIKEEVDLNSLIRSSVDFVLAGSKVSAAYDLEENLRSISADPSQIEQMINNLVINAVQAMPTGGHLYIKARNLSPDEMERLPAENNAYIRFDVTDAGVGIPEENLAKIFDPFFTTKETGTGLGLSTVKSIVQNHGGTVLVDTKVGKGTTMSVILPAIEKRKVSPASIARLDVARTGSILVMDDDEPILDVMGTMLEKFGYEAVCVENGEEAISAYKERLSSAQPFNMVIMDLTIRGGMGGKEAIKEILALDPKARVIVSSGYSNDPIMANPHEYGFLDVLQKPFTMKDLSSKISLVMEQKAELKSGVVRVQPVAGEALR